MIFWRCSSRNEKLGKSYDLGCFGFDGGVGSEHVMVGIEYKEGERD